ncbi:MAG: hypothetical protein GXP26_05450 [Planctomycetes bacterium]|nr:hypothetical protein [Planctomycetota bacterium]
MPNSQRAVSSLGVPPEIFDAAKSSMRSLTPSACRLLILPSRIVLRLPSESTNKMRRRPPGSFDKEAMPIVSFRFMVLLCCSL